MFSEEIGISEWGGFLFTSFFFCCHGSHSAMDAGILFILAKSRANGKVNTNIFYFKRDWRSDKFTEYRLSKKMQNFLQHPLKDLSYPGRLV